MKSLGFFLLMAFMDQVAARELLSTEAQKRCQPVDLRNKLPPIRDQKNTGWCYAYVAADLASFYTGKNISALDIALNYYGTFKAKFMFFFRQLFENKKTQLKSYEKTGGIVIDALNVAQRTGLCLEEKFPSYHKFMDLKALLRLMDYIKVEFDKDAFFTANTMDIRLLAHQIIDINYSFLATMFSDIEFDDFVDILINSTEDSFVQQMVSHVCQPRISFKAKVTEFYWNQVIEPGEKPFVNKVYLKRNKIHELLNDKNIVALSYDPDVLSNSNYYKTKFIPGNYHASTVVGRRWSESHKKCELLIRNSWGKSCGGYDKAYDCHEGYVWIEEDTLMRATTVMTYIDKKN